MPVEHKSQGYLQCNHSGLKRSPKWHAAAAAKSLQSCPTLCDTIDGRQPTRLLLPWARTLEWVAISFSNAWKWKVKVKPFSRVQLWATPWTWGEHDLYVAKKLCGAGTASSGCTSLEQLRGETPRPRSRAAAMRKYPRSNIRTCGCTLLEQPWRIPHVQGKRNPSKTVGTERGHQNTDRLKPNSQTTSQSDHTDHSLV